MLRNKGDAKNHFSLIIEDYSDIMYLFGQVKLKSKFL